LSKERAEVAQEALSKNTEGKLTGGSVALDLTAPTFPPFFQDLWWTRTSLFSDYQRWIHLEWIRDVVFIRVMSGMEVLEILSPCHRS